MKILSVVKSYSTYGERNMDEESLNIKELNMQIKIYFFELDEVNQNIAHKFSVIKHSLQNKTRNF